MGLPTVVRAFLVLVLCGTVVPVCCGNFKGCGMRNADVGGSEMKQLEYPWHVALYKQLNSTKPPEYICGGTIIHQKLILTAAVCIYDEDIFDAANATFIVAAGKYNSSWDYRGPTEQRFKVVKINIPEAYFGSLNRFADNIAVLTLNETIIFSNLVMPVCIYWKQKVHRIFVNGTVIGWGITENGSLSSELVAVEIKYYGFNTCKEKFHFEGYGELMLPLLTSDKYCAAPSNSTALNQGNIGGGLMVQIKLPKNLELYFLQGIVNVKDPSNVTLFTSIVRHLRWIQFIITSLTDTDQQLFPIDKHNDFTECGIRYAVNSHIPTIKYGSLARHSEYPWHVALFRQFNSNQPPEYICGGSIVHKKLILTAAHCVYDDETHNITNANHTAIIGKYHRSWNHRDSSEQRFKVIDIKTPETYRSFFNRYADDLAILVLNGTITFSSIVMPICLEWDPDIKFQKIAITGTVVGWGITENDSLSEELVVAKLKYYNFTTCSDRFVNEGFGPYVTSDKFCAGLDNGTTVEQGDSGGGLVFLRDSAENKQQFYLRGIVSTRDRNGTNIAAFTDINKHLKWLNDSMSPFIEAEYCPILTSTSVELALCKTNSTDADCNKLARTGTAAKVQCKYTFHAGFPFRLYTETECLKNYTWSPVIDVCIDCGKRYGLNEFVPEVTYKPKQVPVFPWHVALYKRHNRNGTEYRYLCGGTIIHPKAILTAAHCVVDKRTNRAFDPKSFYIVAGKHRVDWKVQDSYEQRFQVFKIYSKDTFTGLDYHFADDIAVLELNETVALNDYVMPACIDWAEKLKLHKKPFTFALYGGWGYLKDDGVLSGELITSRLLYVNLTKCRDLLISQGVKKSIPALSPDKWCATPKDELILSRGDSGGSLTFSRFNEETGEESYYIYGLISVNLTKTDVLGITDVLYHTDWIKDVMEVIIKSMKKKLNI